MADLNGKFALVTGSSRGIGRGIALELARAGAHVAVHYRRERDAAEATAREIEALGRKSVVVAADVSDWPQVKAMAETVLQHFGRLDIVVANSGVASRPAPVWEMDIEHWQRVIAVDLHGAFYTCRATVGHLVRQGSGSVILVSSIGADLCAPFGAPYYAAKAGVNALTKTLAKECAPARVRVNAIAPGLVHTDMGERMLRAHGDALLSTIPLGRAGTPEEIGKAAVFLASDDAAFITGKILRIDGGAWM
ncbi:MAG: 3-oxoacyl-[acyl-carrier-protein] reductase FabG [Candidatus Binatia bacterium]|nr:MAG: 3-oxoacyl-[acyl-carrier-protein] reductase FabG [Candidatus Binatia bacterium]